MPSTHIPPRDPVAPPPKPAPPGSELYDAGHWVRAYRATPAPLDAPALLVQLEDDLARSRMREAFWISVVVHLVVIIGLVNSERLARLFPQRHSVFLVTPNDWMRQRDLTYLELPPDAQKIAKRAETNVISDKDRVASRRPELDPNELRKILDSSRPGNPGPIAPPTPPQQAQAPAKPQGLPQDAQPQVARVQPPVAPKILFGGSVTAGSAIEQAARAALANPGSGGNAGDMGLTQGQPGTATDVNILTDTMGVDFGPYLARVLHDVRTNWYLLIPEVARPPLMKKGKVSIIFLILPDGRVANMNVASTSGDVALDRAAWAGITNSNPFPPLPTEFKGKYLGLAFHFYYNPDSNDLR
jgi:TonB family protein